MRGDRVTRFSFSMNVIITVPSCIPKMIDQDARKRSKTEQPLGMVGTSLGPSGANCSV